MCQTSQIEQYLYFHLNIFWRCTKPSREVAHRWDSGCAGWCSGRAAHPWDGVVGTASTPRWRTRTTESVAAVDPPNHLREDTCRKHFWLVGLKWTLTIYLHVTLNQAPFFFRVQNVFVINRNPNCMFFRQLTDFINAIVLGVFFIQRGKKIK